MTRRRVVIAALVTTCLVAAYALSYAPIYRSVNGADPPPGFGLSGRNDDAWQRLYRPIEWLTDSETWLNAPLRSWARLWDINFQLLNDSAMRKQGIAAF